MSVVHEMMIKHLSPGPTLHAITAVQVDLMGSMLNAEVPANMDAVEVNLYAWQQHIFSLCNAHAIYGPENIFAMDPELESQFWDFENGMLGLVIDILTPVTARKAHLARKKVLDGLVEYVQHERYKKASALIQDRVETNLSFGFSKEMAGHAELILMFGILGNAVPSTFWLIAHIFSRPELLQQIREEVQSALDITPPTSRKELNSGPKQPTRTCSISAKAITESCPLLYSCYRETLRDISLLTSARLVLEDTILADKYLLRKNSVIQIAGGVIHQSRRVWGQDAKSFNPERFLVSPSHCPDDEPPTKSKASLPSRQATPLPKGISSAAFRAFGGGTVICPGRHFAQSEIMTFAAVLALSFDIAEIDGGTLRLPGKDDTRIPLSVVKPTYDPRVRIGRRRGWEGVVWEIKP